MFTSDDHSESTMAVVHETKDHFSRRLSKIMEDFAQVESDNDSEWESASSLINSGDAEEHSDLSLCEGSYI